MYVPVRYRPENEEAMLAVVREFPFAALVSSEEGSLSATHLPLDLAGPRLLRGHFARGNPHWKALSPDRDVMAIFQGPHAYVSSRWFVNADVPTWNYVAVHVTGRPRIVDDPAELREFVASQMSLREAAHAYSIDSLPPAVVDPQLKRIVGFEITITRIEGAFKLGQPGGTPDHESVARELEKGTPGDQATADWMKKTSGR